MIEKGLNMLKKSSKSCEVWRKLQKMQMAQWIAWKIRNEGYGKSRKASKHEKEGWRP